jgi:hypothetical protein
MTVRQITPLPDAIRPRWPAQPASATMISAAILPVTLRKVSRPLGRQTIPTPPWQPSATAPTLAAHGHGAVASEPVASAVGANAGLSGANAGVSRVASRHGFADDFDGGNAGAREASRHGFADDRRSQPTAGVR